jgi:hypothetical protein
MYTPKASGSFSLIQLDGAIAAIAVAASAVTESRVFGMFSLDGLIKGRRGPG